MLEFTLTEADLAAFAAHQASESGEADVRSRPLRVVSAWAVGVAGYLVVAVVATIPLLLANLLLWAGLAELAALGFGVLLGYLDWRKGGLLTTPLVTRRYRLKARESLSRTGTQRRLSADADGITIATGDKQTRVTWAQVQRITETPGHYFLYTGPNGAHVIPRRVGEAETAAFVSTILDHL
ncbi:MAG: YcxB family protein [Propionibacteriaceae bacterium]|nr:YcxB family protein [Propionibacteriaceae bacterium]